MCSSSSSGSLMAMPSRGARQGRRACWVAVVAVAVVLVAASCSSGGGNDSASSATSATTTSTTAPPSTTTPAEDPYPDFTPAMYAGTKNWLCHPDIDRAECTDQPETVVKPDRSLIVQPAAPAKDPSIDCFYVYPTVSSDPGVSSDLQPDAELSTVAAQAARFSKVCRLYAPMYRQVTLAGIGMRGTAGGDLAKADAQANADVLDAWKTYLKEDNHGRGVVLIGHSQGMSRLITLMKAQVDDNPTVRDRIVSAILMGGSVQVPDGKTVGGTFQHLPACTKASETGCLVTFSSWPAASPPTAAGIFGRDAGNGQVNLCVNPVELAGGNDLADTVVPRKAPRFAANPAMKTLPGTTPYVSLPGTFKAACTAVNGHHVLLYSPSGDTADTRPLSPLLNETLGPTWGLHLVDASLPQDDLIEIVRQQAAAWVDEHGQPADAGSRG